MIGDDVQCGGVTVRRGDYMVADADGVVAVPASAVDGVLEIVRRKANSETVGREELLAGASVRDVWDRYGVF